MAQYSYESVREDYAKLWDGMKVVKTAEASAQAQRIIHSRTAYEEVQADTGVPWFVVGCLHMRESNADFNRWLHNGDPMKNKAGKPIKTVNVPAGRPPNPAISWREGAYDALVICEQLDKIKDWGPERVAYAMEKFNGFGYRSPSRNIPSPYLWGGTSVQKTGKFISDGKYDANTMDTQVGGMAVLRALMDLNTSIRFANNEPSKPEPEVKAPLDAPVPLSPAAIEVAEEQPVRPAVKSKTIIGGFLSWLMGLVGGGFSFLQYLNNPYTLAGFILFVIILSVAFWLIISGRLELTKLVDHLAEDNK